MWPAWLEGCFLCPCNKKVCDELAALNLSLREMVRVLGAIEKKLPKNPDDIAGIDVTQTKEAKP